MSPKYLIVAEVDKIQSFIFQSARLREVVGASHLLTTFCDDIKTWINPQPTDILNSSGGSFRLVFASELDAKLGAETLRLKFEQQIGGSITITAPIEYDPQKKNADGKPDMVAMGNRKLRQAKLGGNDPIALWQSPYHAICALSGSELAVAYQKPVDVPDEREKYVGQLTLKKAELDAKASILRVLQVVTKDVTGLSKIKIHEKATQTDTYAWDARQYVAYLVADGNRMGAYFNGCTPENLKKLAPEVGKITTKAFVESSMHLVERSKELPRERGFTGDTLPVLPLITGGDDLFALMPASWAVDVAARFCAAYQAGMTERLHSMTLLNEKENATIGAAIVICKASYPYRTAYEYGHELLNKAKERAKSENQSCLIVDFVVGSDTVRGSNTRREPHAYRPDEADYFLKQRFELQDLPSRILHQTEVPLLKISECIEEIKKYLQKLNLDYDLHKYSYDPEDLKFPKFDLANDLPEVMEKWRYCKIHLDNIVKQVKRLYSDDWGVRLEKALKSSGQLLELLKLWDFCLCSELPQSDYETGER